jgi:hypothetical protein
MEANWVQNCRQVHAAAFKAKLEYWLRHEKYQRDLTLVEVLRLLNEEYLISLPLSKEVVWPQSPGARNFWFFFWRYVAHLLSWSERKNKVKQGSFLQSSTSTFEKLGSPMVRLKSFH